MEMTDFLNSGDIAEHWRRIGFFCTPLQSAYLVWHNRTKTLAEKHAAWREIIQSMPDCPVAEGHRKTNMGLSDALAGSLHEFLRAFIALQENLIKCFYQRGDHAVYRYRVLYEGDEDWSRDSWLYDSADDCFDDISVDGQLASPVLCVQITKQWIGNNRAITLSARADRAVMEVDAPNSDADGEASGQSVAKLRVALKKSMNKTKALRSELQKSIENTQVLDAAVRERAEVILQLTSEKQRFSDIVDELRGQVAAKDITIQKLGDQIDEQTKVIEALSNEKKSMNDQLSACGRKIDDMDEVRKRLESETKEKEALKIEVERLKSEMEKQRLQLKEQVLNQPSATSLLMGLGASQSETRGDLCEKVQQLEAELEALRKKPSAESVRTFNEERAKFDALREKTLKEISEKQESIRQERRSLEELKQALNTQKEKLRRDLAKFEQESCQYRQEKQRFDEQKRQDIADRTQLDHDMAVYRREKGEFDKRKEAMDREIAKLEELRESEMTERQRLEEEKAKFEDMDLKYMEYERKYKDYMQQKSELEEAQKAFAKEREEAKQVIAMKTEVEMKQHQIELDKKRLERDQARCGEMTDKINADKSAIDEMKAQWETKVADLKQKETDLKDRFRALEDTKAELAAKETKLDNDREELERQKQMIGPELEMAQQIESLNHKVSVQHETIVTVKRKLRKLWERKKQLKRMLKKEKITYLKKALLEFFAQNDQSIRDTLVPVLLRIVECNEQEIQAAVNSWSGSRAKASIWPFK